MRRPMYTLLLSALMLSAPCAYAEISASANVALASDYVFRGFSQTKEDPALSGGFDLSLPNGLYLGTWASNVNFEPNAHLELDLYGGWSREFDNGVGLDLGVIQYEYFDSSVAEFTEVYGGVSYSLFSATLYYDVNSDQDDYLVAELGVSKDLGPVAATATLGLFEPDEGSGDYNYWSIGVSKELGEFGFDLSYHDTDVDNDENADGRVVLTVSKEL